MKGKRSGSSFIAGKERYPSPDLREILLLSLMIVFLMVILRLKGDSTMLKLRFDFLIKPRRSSLV